LEIFKGSCPLLFAWWLLSGWLESVAAAVDRDNLGVMEQAVEYRAGGGDIAEQFAHSSMGRLEVLAYHIFAVDALNRVLHGCGKFSISTAELLQGPDVGGGVPVIAMSAFFSQTDRAHTHDADFQACLPKPFTPDNLVDTILDVL
jgi:CheY-like chemotaxis protein